MGKFQFGVDISLLQKGDKRSFEKIFLEFSDLLYHLSLQYVQKEEIAEEMVQDAFIKLWDVRDSINDNKNLKNFLYTITKNNCLNYLRSQKAILQTKQDLKYIEMQLNYDALNLIASDNIEFIELQEKIETAINHLPEDIRTVFRMSRFEDLKYKEIAEKLNVSQKTVEVRMSKALSILKIDLKDYLFYIYLITNILC
ncbi:MAG: RNA polymerase sigma-70 factor [Labilibaculum sp.]|nr:RNA polymerase sigma-70 factor [Labilibaculum sp.]MBI9057339.1 RNA polymerase sigma-70 factor [Labilibaculum sp.]